MLNVGSFTAVWVRDDSTRNKTYVFSNNAGTINPSEVLAILDGVAITLTDDDFVGAVTVTDIV